jgi:phosphate transport system substrate-binding protein
MAAEQIAVVKWMSSYAEQIFIQNKHLVHKIDGLFRGGVFLSRTCKVVPSLCILLVVASAFAASAHAQSADQLFQVKKLYVDSFGAGRGAAQMRDEMLHLLQKSHDVQIVPTPKDADAIVKGTGQIWVTGQVSLSPHSHSATERTFEGFLSAEVVGKNGDTLWSYLVTPSNFPWKGITNDLARQMVSKLLAALKGEGAPEASVAGPQASTEGTLRGAGATFPAPLYQRWFELFQEQNPKVHISYDAVGSAVGIQRLEAGKVDFAASEMPVSDEEMAQAHQQFVHIPTVLGAVVAIYHLADLHQSLNFTPEMLSGIYLGKITKWNDPEIRRSNSGITLPNADIVAVHRSDGSGTTFVWSDYLSKISPQWKTSVGAGATVQWPVGVGAEGNEGVAATVQHTPNSIGYVEFIYAIQHELSFGAIRNAAGQFIKADISGVTAAAATATAPSHDFRVSITNAPGESAYPISTYTWLLLPQHIEGENEEGENKNDKAKNVLLTEFLRWMLTSGQKKCSGLGYAPLPAEVAKRALESFDSAK